MCWALLHHQAHFFIFQDAMRNQFHNLNAQSGRSVPAANCAPGTHTDSSSLFGRERGLGPIDFAELRRQVTIRQVLELLQWQPVSQHGPQWRGPCPVHRSSSEQSRSFSVNAEKHVFRCFKPKCDAKGNQLDLYALATGLPLLEAAHLLCQRLGIAAPTLPNHPADRRSP